MVSILLLRHWFVFSLILRLDSSGETISQSLRDDWDIGENWLELESGLRLIDGVCGKCSDNWNWVKLKLILRLI